MRGEIASELDPTAAPAPRSRVWQVSWRGTAPAGGGEERVSLLFHAVGRLDGLLRRYYGVEEFSSAPDCLLRLGTGAAERPVVLGDGTRLEAGERIGILHLWNERLPPYRRDGPDMRWAKDVARRFRVSFKVLARHVEAEPAWRDVRAFRADAAFGGHLGLEQMRWVATRYGFDALTPERSLARRTHDFCENALIWGMVAAFNPGGLGRHRFCRERFELWVSRRSLVERYGSGPVRDPAAAA
jgi:hypothetical protein